MLQLDESTLEGDQVLDYSSRSVAMTTDGGSDSRDIEIQAMLSNAVDKCLNPIVRERLDVKRYGQNLIKRLSGSDVDVGLFQKEGFTHPILVEHSSSIAGLRAPKEAFRMADLKAALGARRVLKTINSFDGSVADFTLKEFLRFFLTPSIRPSTMTLLLNNLDLSRTKLCALVDPPEIVTQLDWANVGQQTFCNIGSQDTDSGSERYRLQRLLSVSMEGAYTDYQFGSSGASVWLHLVSGAQMIWLVPPSGENHERYVRWMTHRDEKTALQGSRGYYADLAQGCQAVVLNCGSTIFIPAGWIYARYTLQDSTSLSGLFLHSFSVDAQLATWHLEDLLQRAPTLRYPRYVDTHWYILAAYVSVLFCPHSEGHDSGLSCPRTGSGKIEGNSESDDTDSGVQRGRKNERESERKSESEKNSDNNTDRESDIKSDRQDDIPTENNMDSNSTQSNIHTDKHTDNYKDGSGDAATESAMKSKELNPVSIAGHNGEKCNADDSTTTCGLPSSVTTSSILDNATRTSEKDFSEVGEVREEGEIEDDSGRVEGMSMKRKQEEVEVVGRRSPAKKLKIISADDADSEQLTSLLGGSESACTDQSTSLTQAAEPAVAWTHLSPHEREGIRAIVDFLEVIGPQSAPKDIKDPKYVLKQATILLSAHESDDAKLAVTGRPVLSSHSKSISKEVFKLIVKPSRSQRSLAQPPTTNTAIEGSDSAAALTPSSGHLQVAVSGTSPAPPRRRRVRCKKCERCTSTECGECLYCQDMKKFGGQGRLKQTCVARQCIAPILPTAAICYICKRGEESEASVGRAREAGACDVGVAECDVGGVEKVNDNCHDKFELGMEEKESEFKKSTAVGENKEVGGASSTVGGALVTMGEDISTSLASPNEVGGVVEMEAGKKMGLLMECGICWKICHPACLREAWPGLTSEGVVNDDLPNSWECPVCREQGKHGQSKPRVTKGHSTTSLASLKSASPPPVASPASVPSQEAGIHTIAPPPGYSPSSEAGLFTVATSTLAEPSKTPTTTSSEAGIFIKAESNIAQTIRASSEENPAGVPDAVPSHSGTATVDADVVLGEVIVKKEKEDVRNEKDHKTDIMSSEVFCAQSSSSSSIHFPSGHAPNQSSHTSNHPGPHSFSSSQSSVGGVAYPPAPPTVAPIGPYVVRPLPCAPPPKHVVTTTGHAHVLDREAWLRVFGWLDVRELAACMRVCKTWNRWAHDQRLWRHMVVSRQQLRKQHLIGIVRRQPKSLDVSWTNISHRQLSWLHARLPHLKSLSLAGNSWPAVSALVLPTAPHCPLLCALDLSWVSSLSDACVIDLLRPPPTSALNESWPATIGYGGSGAGLSRLRRCETLRLAGADVTDASLTAISRYMPRLRVLDLSYCVYISDAGVKAVLSAGSSDTGCTNSGAGLSELVLTGCSRVTGAVLAWMCKSCTSAGESLRVLRIDRCEQIEEQHRAEFIRRYPLCSVVWRDDTDIY